MRPRSKDYLPVLVRLLAAGVLAVAVASCGASVGDPSPAGSGTPDSFEVGVLQIAEAAVLDDTVAAFQRRLAEELAPATVNFDLKNAQGDQSLVASIARDFAGSDADAFAVIGTPAVIAMAQQITDRPIIAIAMGRPGRRGRGRQPRGARRERDREHRLCGPRDRPG